MHCHVFKQQLRTCRAQATLEGVSQVSYKVSDIKKFSRQFFWSLGNLKSRLNHKIQHCFIGIIRDKIHWMKIQLLSAAACTCQLGN